MNAIRTAILDDEPLALRLLTDYVGKLPELTLVLASTDPFQVLDLVQTNQIDLVLLDIQMPELTGIQFLKIAQKRCKTILITAYEEYALQGFEHDVVDYLLKPIAFERFALAIGKLRERMATAPPVAEQKTPGYIFVKSEYKIVKVDFKDILYLESARDYTMLHTTGGRLLTLQSLRSFEEALPPHQFVRLHKSFIVALDKISSIENGRVVVNKVYLPIGEAYKAGFWERVKLK